MDLVRKAFKRATHIDWQAGALAAAVAVRVIVEFTFDDGLILGGYAAVVYGLGLVYRPAAFIVGGAMALALWLRRHRSPNPKAIR